MAWQRLLCVGFYAVTLASAASAEPTIETSPPRTQFAKHNAATAQQDVKPTTKAGARSASVAKPQTSARSRERKVGQVGYASWYGSERHGKPTASGRRFDKTELTAAHRTLPLHSKA